MPARYRSSKSVRFAVWNSRQVRMLCSWEKQFKGYLHFYMTQMAAPCNLLSRWPSLTEDWQTERELTRSLCTRRGIRHICCWQSSIFQKYLQVTGSTHRCDQNGAETFFD